MSASPYVHEYECTSCGLRFRGHLYDGRIVPTSRAAASAERLPALCLVCAERDQR